MARGQLFWHVPFWFSGTPSVATGDGNIAENIALELVNTETTAALGQDNFVVERIIGQYLLTNADTTPSDTFVHHRVYVTMGNTSSFFLRDLSTADDADSSFLWHKVELFPAVAGGATAIAGNWRDSTASNVHRPDEGRNGTFDIRVNRRIREGESLLWHTQLEPTPTDGDFRMKMWVRCLLKEA